MKDIIFIYFFGQKIKKNHVFESYLSSLEKIFWPDTDACCCYILFLVRVLVITRMSTMRIILSALLCLVFSPSIGGFLFHSSPSPRSSSPLRRFLPLVLDASPSSSPGELRNDMKMLLEVSLGLSNYQASKLLDRCPEWETTTVPAAAETLARLTTKCNLTPTQLRYLIETTPTLLATEAEKIESVFQFLESSANFGVMEKRNVALVCPGVFDLNISTELAPVLMAITAATDSQSELVLDAFPDINESTLLTIKAVLDIAYSGDDEIELGCGDEEDEDDDDEGA